MLTRLVATPGFIAAAAWLTLAMTAEAQTRTDTYDAAAAAGTHVELNSLPDGGCAIVVACAELVSLDGGGELTGCAQLDAAKGELTNATNRARCAALLELGARRYVRELRFAVDGGG